MSERKTDPAKIRLMNGDDEIVRDLSARTGLRQIEILSRATHAALLAIAKEGRMIYPLEFRMVTRDEGKGNGGETPDQPMPMAAMSPTKFMGIPPAGILHQVKKRNTLRLRK